MEENIFSTALIPADRNIMVNVERVYIARIPERDLHLFFVERNFFHQLCRFIKKRIPV